MGNANTKESAPSDPALAGRRRSVVGPSVQNIDHEGERRARNRISRGDLSFLGLATPSGTRDRRRDREDVPFQHKETRAEREARKLAEERAARAKERERSLKEEHVDGGYLVTLGTYTGTEDFSKPTVRQLQIERKIAPFWRGLNDWSDSWAEHQLIAAARGLPIPAADETPDPELVPQPPPPQSESSHNLQNLMVPMGPRTLSVASDRSGSGTQSPSLAGPGKNSPFKASRAAKAIASLKHGSRNASSTDLTPREVHLPPDPFVNGQALEVFLYKDATECPICFLSYPPYLNKTRCCNQAICSECFVQIKRADPHLPEHHPDGQARDPNEGLSPEDPPEMLISEPAACPYCQQPEFGVTYDPPPFRRGLVYSSSTLNLASGTPMSSQSSLHSTSVNPPGQTGRRRARSLSANAPGVITTDRIRPDWATKLAAARNHQARRAAAATALHAAAFMGGDNDHRSILRPGRFSRRNTGRERGASSGPSSEARSGGSPADQAEGGEAHSHGQRARRSRAEELEDMMIKEAVRLSLAAEEERQRKEEKALLKDAKKREKEELKRREREEKKAAKKQGSNPYGHSTGGASGSSLSLSGFGRRRGNSATSNLRMETSAQGSSQGPDSGCSSTPSAEVRDNSAENLPTDKGKAVDRGPVTDPSTPEATSSSPGSLPIPLCRGSSHLRQMSNASSLSSSDDDCPSGSYSGPGSQGPEGTNPSSSGMSAGRQSPDGEGDTSSDPTFNFRSLAEVVGVDTDEGSAKQGEGHDSSGTTHTSTGRPLSQVDEDETEEADAGHVEERKDVDPIMTPATKTDTAEEDSEQREEELLPGLTADTRVASSTEDTAPGDKQLGRSSVAEQPSQVTP